MAEDKHTKGSYRINVAGVTDDGSETQTVLRIDPSTRRLKVTQAALSSSTDSVTIEETNYTTKITESGNYTYVAKAPIGTAQATAGWQAYRIDETSGIIILWADGNDNFDNVVTDLTALSYS